jgi:ribonuclease PH
VEIQGTAEGHAFSKEEFDSLMVLAARGIGQIIEAQKKAIAGEGRA